MDLRNPQAMYTGNPQSKYTPNPPTMDTSNAQLMYALSPQPFGNPSMHMGTMSPEAIRGQNGSNVEVNEPLPWAKEHNPQEPEHEEQKLLKAMLLQELEVRDDFEAMEPLFQAEQDNSQESKDEEEKLLKAMLLQELETQDNIEVEEPLPQAQEDNSQKPKDEERERLEAMFLEELEAQDTIDAKEPLPWEEEDKLQGLSDEEEQRLEALFQEEVEEQDNVEAKEPLFQAEQDNSQESKDEEAMLTKELEGQDDVHVSPEEQKEDKPQELEDEEQERLEAMLLEELGRQDYDFRVSRRQEEEEDEEEEEQEEEAEEEARRKKKEEGMKQWEIAKIPKIGTTRLFYDPPNPNVGGHKDYSAPSTFTSGQDKREARKAQTAQKRLDKQQAAAEARAQEKAAKCAAKKAEQEAARQLKMDQREADKMRKQAEEQARKMQKAAEKQAKQLNKHQQYLTWEVACPDDFGTWVETAEGQLAYKRSLLMGIKMTGRRLAWMDFHLEDDVDNGALQIAIALESRATTTLHTGHDFCPRDAAVLGIHVDERNNVQPHVRLVDVLHLKLHRLAVDADGLVVPRKCHVAAVVAGHGPRDLVPPVVEVDVVHGSVLSQHPVAVVVSAVVVDAEEDVIGEVVLEAALAEAVLVHRVRDDTDRVVDHTADRVTQRRHDRVQVDRVEHVVDHLQEVA
ncbi:hypothetical protein PpBr36_02558 [Pyricularia pennisetigena]|uniref:hypothetical protein n=1 Tax=Pyricularia pennisetigena TaxID=1578925 RepID=UPI00115005E1|nr:hypothetical protein PpBr36_02558 [Pyricularia pennisetigena]TLS31617.1 hypothetical protein PpBr36_02558 [Pyricularia pennisetigena]